jgi:D-3-phosphoglycerate dehydrogenase
MMKPRMKIVIAEKTSPAAIQIFREEPKWQVVTAEQIEEGKLPEQVAEADALVVRSAVQVDGALLQHARKLRVIGRAGVGVDNIDLEAATRRGIAVMNTPGANAAAVAEHTFGLMLSLARHLSRADATTRAGKWEKKSLQGTELKGKTLGIVGLGRIGLEVARRARAFGMELVGHDPFVPSSNAVIRELEIKLASLDELYSAADYVTLHVGLTPQTSGMINSESLKKFKSGSRLINCARGELIDEAALAAALRLGHLAGAAIDVFTEEPPKNSALLALENLMATPHIAGSTEEAQEAVGVQIAMQVKEYLKRGVIQNAVNVPSVSHDEYVEMQPYIVLAERLGQFAAQAAEGNVEEISIRYSGRIAEWKTELIRNAAIKGILNLLGDAAERANLVNAAQLAQERGIRVHEVKKTAASGGGAGNVLSLLFRSHRETAGAQEMLVKGAVLHGNSPRLLAVDQIDIEAPLERCIIYLRNRDVPGVIGKVGTILGNHNVNIANFALGREEHGADGCNAIAVVQVDIPVPEEALQELRAVAAITLAKAMKF